MKKLSPQQRNEFDRTKQSKAIRMAHYELGLLIGAMYVFEKIATIWPEPKPYAPLLLVVIAGVGWLWILFGRWLPDSRLLESIANQLKQDAREEGGGD